MHLTIEKQILSGHHLKDKMSEYRLCHHGSDATLTSTLGVPAAPAVAMMAAKTVSFCGSDQRSENQPEASFAMKKWVLPQSKDTGSTTEDRGSSRMLFRESNKPTRVLRISTESSYFLFVASSSLTWINNGWGCRCTGLYINIYGGEDNIIHNK
jgi:hypothetical protein